MNMLAIGFAAILELAAYGQYRLSAKIELSDSVVSVIRFGDIPQKDLWFFAEANDRNKENTVLRIDFSSSTDLRRLSYKLGTIIFGKGYLCALGEENGPLYSADLIADEHGLIAHAGSGPEDLYNSSNSKRRYHAYVNPYSQLDENEIGEREYDLETIAMDFCFVVKADFFTGEETGIGVET